MKSIIFLLVALLGLGISYSLDIGPVKLHTTNCLLARMEDCRACYKNENIAICDRLALGKYLRQVNWKSGDKETGREAHKIVLESCEQLMDKDTDTDSIPCHGFKALFLNEDESNETGGNPSYVANQASNSLSSKTGIMTTVVVQPPKKKGGTGKAVFTFPKNIKKSTFGVTFFRKNFDFTFFVNPGRIKPTFNNGRFRVEFDFKPRAGVIFKF